jgi:hypothetical protein
MRGWCQLIKGEKQFCGAEQEAEGQARSNKKKRQQATTGARKTKRRSTTSQPAGSAFLPFPFTLLSEED